MIKIKYNEVKDTFTIKGLTTEHMDVINTLLYHTRLGNNTDATMAASDLAEAMEQYSTEPTDLILEAECEDCGCNCRIDSTTLNLY